MIIFVVVGCIIGACSDNEKHAIQTIIIITILWAFVYQIWAIAAFVEMCLGYGIVHVIKDKIH